MGGDSTSNGQVLSDDVVAQIGGGSPRYDGALAHDGVGAGEAPRELEVLLHEEDGDAALLDALDGALDLEDHVGLDALRRLVHQEKLGSGEEYAGDGELLLLAAREHTALARKELSELRKELEDLLDVLLSGAPVAGRLGAAEESHAEGLGHAQIRKDLASLGHVADPAGRPLFRSKPSQVDAVERDAPGACRQESHDGLEQRGLAHAAPAYEAHDATCGHVEGHIPQHLALAVGDVEVADLKHARP